MFAVIWMPSANGDFTVITFTHVDRWTEIEDAGDEIEDQLRNDPSRFGQHISEGLWRITSGPLAAYYSIEGTEVIVDRVHWIG